MSNPGPNTQSTQNLVPIYGVLNPDGSIAGFSGNGSAAPVVIAESCEGHGASPSASATVNAAAINAALAAGGLVTLTTPGTYSINNTLLIGSNTRFMLGDGVKIFLAAATNKSMIKTTAISNADTTVTITSSGNVATVAWTAHGKAVGDWISILGAAQQDYNGVWRVATVPTADTLTYFLDVVSATSPSTGTISARTANHNIEITGGEWDANLANQTFVSDSVDKHAILLAYCAFPKFIGNVSNSFKYAVSFQNNYSLLVRDSEFYTTQTGADGVHVTGPQRGNALIDTVTGRTGDDIVGITNSDTSPWNLTSGDISKISVRNIHLTSGLHSIVKIDGTATGYVMKAIDIDGLYGTSVDPCVYILVSGGGATHVNKLTIRNVGAVSTTAGNPVVNIDTATVDQLIVNGVNVALSANAALVRAAATATITDLSVSNVTATLAAGGGGAIIDMANTATFGKVNLDNYTVSASGGYMIRLDGAVTEVSMSNGHQTTGGSMLSFTGTGSPFIRLSDMYEGAAVGGVTFSASATLMSRNWRHASGTAALTVTAGACSWYGETIANTPLSVSGGSLVPYGIGIKIATTLATYAAGGSYFDTTLNKFRIGGATAWETVTSA